MLPSRLWRKLRRFGSRAPLGARRSAPFVYRAEELAARVFEDRGQLASGLGLDSVREDDIFICSYPKSGNTWVRFLLANLLRADLEVSFRNIGEIVPDLHAKDIAPRIQEMSGQRFIKHHYRQFSAAPRVVYIYRDGRDVLVSYFHYERAAGRFDGSFGEFIRARHRFGAWHEHVETALEAARQRPEAFHLVRYEDLKTSPVAEAQRLARFCGLSPTPQAVEGAAERCALSQMRNMEERHGPEVIEQGTTFFRSGKVGEWLEVFSEADLQMFEKVAGPTLRSLNYPAGFLPAD